LIDSALFDCAQKVLAEGKMQKIGRESRYPASLFEAIRKLSESRPEELETERREAELVTTERKLANLAKRIADLPVGIPANGLYDEMKRLAENQTRLKAEIQESRRRQGNRIKRH
jgi:hypothetical protein